MVELLMIHVQVAAVFGSIFCSFTVIVSLIVWLECMYYPVFHHSKRISAWEPFFTLIVFVVLSFAFILVWINVDGVMEAQRLNYESMAIPPKLSDIQKAMEASHETK